MYKNKLKVKEEKALYIVYHPVPCHDMKVAAHNFPTGGKLCCSIDVGVKNFALRVERRYANGACVPVLFEKIDFMGKEGGSSAVNPEMYKNAIVYLVSRWDIIKTCSLVAMERQMSVNYKSSCVFVFVLSYFLSRIDEFPEDTIIMDISPKVKGRYLGAPKGITSSQLKQWSIEKALEMLEFRGDMWSVDVILHHKGKAKTKGDDLADTATQLEGIFIMLGGVTCTNEKPPSISFTTSPRVVTLLKHGEPLTPRGPSNIDSKSSPLVGKTVTITISK